MISFHRLSNCRGLAVAALVASLPVPMLPADVPAAAPDLSKLPAPATTTVDFARDIRPLFAERCVKCHGPEKQKSGLRLDVKAAAMKGGDGGKAIELAKSADSRLIHLVAGLEEDKVMPPKGERLTAQQIGLLRAWIDQGADWPEDGKTRRSEHWAYQPIRPAAGKAGNAIDTFLAASLAAKGLALSPPADPATLMRRLSFDLIGLPPTPVELDTFVADRSPGAYEALVERLLASPRYGERWGRHWLDVVRYTESQGFEYDRARDNAWHYRDYVIKCFNDDKPFDRFMKEQLAGDVLEPVTRDGIVGTSLLVCGPWDQAGNAQANATQKAITREEELEDMISVVGQTFLGLTLNCARCHSHKFDPIPQEEYYRIKSVFDGVKHGERPIEEPAQTKARVERNEGLRQEIASAQQTISTIEAEGRKLALSKRGADARPAGPTPFLRWTFEGSSNAAAGELKGGAKVASGGLVLSNDHRSLFESTPLQRDIREKTLEAWVTLGDLQQGGGAAISIESERDRDFDAIVFSERQPKKWIAGSGGFQRTRDLDAPEETAAPGTLICMAVVYRSDNSIAVFRNGEPYGKPYTPAEPLRTYQAGTTRVLLGLRHHGAGNGFLGGTIQQAALYDRALSAEEIAASFRSAGFSIPLAEVVAHLSDRQRSERDAAIAQVKTSEAKLNAPEPPAAVSYVGLRVQPSPTKLLRRGDVKSPGEVVRPGALSAIIDLDPEFGLAADAPEAQRRLKFAEWLADARNPLPARVMANRIWHFHFGQGLVTTPSDFGVSGARPTHPELLDWLASKFISSGWSVKSLQRLIVNSAAYRQSSAVSAEAMKLDADNTLLWRFTPRRLEAEAVRDAMLAASGELNLRLGGPSFRPFTTTDFNATFYHPFDKDDPEFNRRTVYRMNINSGKEPLLDAFDCPDPSVKTPRRGVTITPLQALELMNNSFVQRQAARLARRALREAGEDLAKAAQTAYRLALNRLPTREELERALAAAQTRSLTNVCWALLNSTEFIYVR